MKNTSLNVLYKFNKEILKGSYSISLLFDHEGFLDLDQESNSFESLDDLAQYSSQVLEEHKLGCAYLLSSEEFNNALDNSLGSKEEFAQIFSKFGTKIDSESSNGAKGIFDRFFN